MLKVSNNRWAILGASYLMVVGVGLPYFGWTPSLTTIAGDLSLNYAQAGALSSVTALTAGVALLLGGMLVVRWGCKNVILIGLVTGVAGELIFAAAETYSVGMLARAIAGVAVGLLLVAPYTLVVNWFLESKQTGRAIGVMVSGDGIGILFALFAFALILNAAGWRTGLVAQAVYLGLLFVVALLVIRNAPASELNGPRQDASPNRSGALAGIMHSVRNRNVLVAVAFYIGAQGLLSLMASWMPTILVANAGWSESTAGLFTSLFSVAGILPAILAGLFSDKIGKRKLPIAAAGLLMTAFVGLLSISIASQNYVLAAVSLPLIGLAGYAGAPLSLASANESVAPEYAGAVNGVVLGAAFLVGGFVYPYAFGAVLDATGSVTSGFVISAAATFVLCFVMPWLGRDAVRKPGAPAAARPAVADAV